MTTMRHGRWNIQYDAITLEQAERMPADIVQAEINKLRRICEEAQFLLMLHQEGIVPESLKIDWPEDDYRAMDDYNVWLNQS